MSDNDDGTGGSEDGGAPGYGRTPWSIAEIRVMLARLEGRMSVSEARTDAGLSEMKAYVAESRSAVAESRSAVAESRNAVAELGKAAAERDARAAEAAAARENRLVMWVVVTVGVATTILGALMGFLALFPHGG